LLSLYLCYGPTFLEKPEIFPWNSFKFLWQIFVQYIFLRNLFSLHQLIHHLAVFSCSDLLFIAAAEGDEFGYFANISISTRSSLSAQWVKHLLLDDPSDVDLSACTHVCLSASPLVQPIFILVLPLEAYQRIFPFSLPSFLPSPFIPLSISLYNVLHPTNNGNHTSTFINLGRCFFFFNTSKLKLSNEVSWKN
jgi:hypothetical protein